jgi:hypothetical protein
MASHKIREHDVVGLKHGVGKWPARQKGTVLAEKDDWKLVEIADSQGAMLDLISVPESDLVIGWTSS